MYKYIPKKNLVAGFSIQQEIPGLHIRLSGVTKMSVTQLLSSRTLRGFLGDVVSG